MRKIGNRFFVLMSALAVVIVSACEKQPATPPVPVTKAALLPATLFAASQPAPVKSVEEVKALAKVGDTVVVRGRVGGGKSPFVDDRAIFTLMGDGLKACSDNNDDECSTPWDYCCDTPADIAAHSLTIQVLDQNGAPLKTGIRGQHGIKELSQLVIVGQFARIGESGVLVNATNIQCIKP